ncbi:hypothetical protein F4818DRAFT_12173 [Hypoxylon cercidicola]|nr:hypothetical protein F4818DRAFT_12173 [Hypoxylon cercidicola]
MEHVAEDHGDEIRLIKAPCNKDLKKELNNIKLPTNIEEFYAFPEKCGWEVTEKFELKPLKKSGRQRDIIFLLQAWLFFGLMNTVVQINGNPLAKPNKLLNSLYLSTKHLHENLSKWAEWQGKHQDGLRFRMVQAGWILDYARQVIRKTCAFTDGQVRYEVSKPNDKTALVLMCFGEALCQAKAGIMQTNKVETSGWHADDRAGWGPPRYVFEQMNPGDSPNGSLAWCPRTVQLLKGQLVSNATMLAAAYYAYKTARRDEDHQAAGCTAEKCLFRSMATDNNYRTRHLCNNPRTCRSIGPQQDEVLDVLRSEKNSIPLIKFSATPDNELDFKIIEFDLRSNESMDFVTISHVWSDGWGNEEANELNVCQLEFIKRQIKRATEDSRTPFWMDTLLVPVKKVGEKELKKKALGQIFDIFDASSHTIILDNGLSQMEMGDKPAETAMKILSSVWMRRLWTLQEAYLSRNIYIAFDERELVDSSVIGLDEIEKDLDIRIADSATSGIIRMIREQLSSIIMGEERRERNSNEQRRQNKKILREKAATVVANAWRAARWRTTSKAEHEVLALATLLNLEAREIEDAGLDEPLREGVPEDVNKLERLVQIFWEEYNRKYKNSIPSGMIFLPGEKLNIRGFGWAPRTWLSAHELDYPDPLSFGSRGTALYPGDGLRVSYPGFLLHPDSSSVRGKILGTTAKTDRQGNEEKFSFPVDRSLDEWYSFTRADDRNSGPLDRLKSEDARLAIILSRPRPREYPREIALLVEIYRTESPRTNDSSDETSDPNEVHYYCRIIHRIMIWRESNQGKTADEKMRFKYGNYKEPENTTVCLGEVLPSTQRWWVDGYVKGNVTERNSQEGSGRFALLSRTSTFLNWATGGS